MFEFDESDWVCCHEAILQLMRDRIAATPGGQKAFARAAGLSPAYISDVLHGRRDIGGRLAGFLGYRRLYAYAWLGENTQAAETNTSGDFVDPRQGATNDFVDALIEELG